MVQMLLVRAGSTDFDEQGRIKGTLDIPLNEVGQSQVAQLVADLRGVRIDYLYASPNRSAQQTAASLATDHQVRLRTSTSWKTLTTGCGTASLIEEVRVSQPKVFRQLQEHPETVCPPQGEPLRAAFDRVREVLSRLVRKHREGVVAIVVPEPLASIVRSTLSQCEPGDLWKAECECGGWQLLDVPRPKRWRWPVDCRAGVPRERRFAGSH
jgi:phosphoserine phosphatase